MFEAIRGQGRMQCVQCPAQVAILAVGASTPQNGEGSCWHRSRLLGHALPGPWAWLRRIFPAQTGLNNNYVSFGLSPTLGVFSNAMMSSLI